MWVSVLGEVRKDAGRGKERCWGVEKCGEWCGRVHGVSGEVCWGVGGGEGSCGKGVG